MMRRERRRERRHPIRRLKERIMTAMSLAGFLAGLLKHVPDIGKFLTLAEAFIAAPVEEKWSAFKPVGDLLYPILLDMLKIQASSYDLHALEAELEAKGFDGSRLKAIWESLSPILLPILMEFLRGKVG